jgi:6-phosphogluconolactonase
LATGSSPESLAVNPIGSYLYAANVTSQNDVTAFSITPSTGELTAVSGSAVGAGTFPINIVLDPSGLLAYVANEDTADISVYTINSTSGILTPAAGSPFAAGSQPRSIAID